MFIKGACGSYGASFTSGKRTTIPNVANIELCFKLCRFSPTCFGWTFDLNNLDCILNAEFFATLALSHGKYDTKTNAKISGPRDCSVWRCKIPMMIGDICYMKYDS